MAEPSLTCECPPPGRRPLPGILNFSGKTPTTNSGDLPRSRRSRRGTMGLTGGAAEAGAIKLPGEPSRHGRAHPCPRAAGPRSRHRAGDALMTTHEYLSLIDPIADRAEAAWKQGERPCLE